MEIRITEQLAQSLYRPIASDSHKGRQGHALIVAGSHGKIGAAVLATHACLRSGAGLVTAFVPTCGYPILQTAVPEAMVLTDPHDHYLTDIRYDISPDAIGIGPGIGTEPATAEAFHLFLQQVKSPLVIDADGLNLLGRNPEWLRLLPAKTILTPHRKELERLIGEWKDETEKRQKVTAFSHAHDLILVLKGAPTSIASGDTIYENTTGNPALASGGTGDCLTGIITGLLAQGYPPLDAAVLGVFLHGKTADIGISETGHEGFTARHVIEYLGRAFVSLYGIPGDHSGN